MKKHAGNTTPSSPPPSRNRTRLFTAIMLAVPVLLVAGTELVLRIAGYGGNQDLVIRANVAGRDFFTINRSIGKKYFAESVATIPEPFEDLFEIRKQKNTKRIFCLGESTIQGFPYEYHATAPAFLRDRLTAMLPDEKIEVVNVGLSAVGSFVVVDFMKDLLRYEPDLFIIYVGHNEFYGAYGVGSSVRSTGMPWMTRLSIGLLKYRTFLALRDLYSMVRHLIAREDRPTGSLMGQMVGNQSIPLGSAEYEEAKEIYRQNLLSIIALAKEHGVPVMFSTLVSNIREQKPFVSLFSPKTSEGTRKEWQELAGAGDSAYAEGNVAACLNDYARLPALDSAYAMGWFKYGQALCRAGRYEEAKVMLRRAKDLDALRFRATEEFQQVLTGVCLQEGIPLVRTDSAFEQSSTGGMIGSELMLEHLHPNIEGYFLMGKVFTDAIRSHAMLVSREEWERSPQHTDAEYMEMSTVSEFDRALGKIKVDLLMRRWPFHQGVEDLKFTPANPVENLVYNYIRGRIPWSEARYRTADYYAGLGSYELARRECRAVAKVLPFSYQPLLKLADYYRQEGDNAKARDAYIHCTAVEDNPFSRMKLAIIELESNDPKEAGKEIERALAVEQTGPHKMGTEALSTAYYLLGAAYARQDRLKDAKDALHHSIAIKADNGSARQLLEKVLGIERARTGRR